MSEVRVRFAPSPTGQVHIGNIRAAIFNWLYARHEGGKFILRIEDTDLERSTPEAIATLLEVMDWLGLNYDEEPLYQTTQVQKHLDAAKMLLETGNAYKDAKGGGGEAVLFRFPWNAEDVPQVSVVGPAEFILHTDAPLEISGKGVKFCYISPKGKAAPAGATLAGFKDLKAFDEAGNEIFDLNSNIDAVLKEGAVFTFPEARKITFTRRQVSYEDQVKGKMNKPLDSLNDFVIVRSDGSPVFHLANVVDDITQGITHIIRGDDHVENTFKHIFLFHCLKAPLPIYGHLPMIVNAQGKPYSKRDGDAFVGDFRDKGFLADTLFNYLSLLGWSPGDDREKMSRAELIEAFSLARCLRTSAQMDIRKMENLNGLYIAAMLLDEFKPLAVQYVSKYDWAASVDFTGELFGKVCAFMQSRVKRFVDVATWSYFFLDMPVYDEAACLKYFKDENHRQALRNLPAALEGVADFTAENVESAIKSVTDPLGIQHGKLNQAVRAAVTGTNIGAGIFETLELIGKERTLKRLAHAIQTYL